MASRKRTLGTAIEIYNKAIDAGWPDISLHAVSYIIGVTSSTLYRCVRQVQDSIVSDKKNIVSWDVDVPEVTPSLAHAPLSEDSKRFHADWDADDCIRELQRIANIDTTKVITRNYFRNNSEISESTWNRYFGTFEEYKRQANITLSRHVHQLEKNIAKHASKTAQLSANSEKRNWEEKYLRPSNRRYQTVLVGSDLHDIEIDKFWLRCFVDVARRVQPEKIVLNGDVFDLPEFGKYSVDPRTWDVVGRIKAVHEILRQLREASPESEIIMIEGNHEFRLLRHLGEATPAMQAVLSDLHGFTVPKLLGLEQFEVNYIARMDLRAFTEADVKRELSTNYHIMYDCLLAHHFPHGRNMGYPGFNGHHHKHIVWPFYSPRYGSTEWHQLGCGHKRSASYCAGEQWGTGFALCHVDTKKFHTQFEYVEIRDHAMIGGKFYERKEEE